MRPSGWETRKTHYGYHRYLTKLYVSSALVSAMYSRSSELGLSNLYLLTSVWYSSNWIGKTLWWGPSPRGRTWHWSKQKWRGRGEASGRATGWYSGSPTDIYLDVTSRCMSVGEPGYWRLWRRFQQAMTMIWWRFWEPWWGWGSSSWKRESEAQGEESCPWCLPANRDFHSLDTSMFWNHSSLFGSELLFEFDQTSCEAI